MGRHIEDQHPGQVPTEPFARNFVSSLSLLLSLHWMGDDDSTGSEEEEEPRTSRISPLILGNANSTTLSSTSTTTMTSLSRATAEDPDTSDLDDGTSGARYANYPYQYPSSECSDGPPSPSPSPRPGSAMGSVSRSRSGTPSITTTMSALSSNFSRMRSGSGSNFSGTGMLGVPSSLSASSPWEHEREQMQRVSSAPTVSAAALKHRRSLSKEFHAPSIPIVGASTVNRPPLEPLQRQRSMGPQTIPTAASMTSRPVKLMPL